MELHWGWTTSETLIPVLNTPNRLHTDLGELWNSTFIKKVNKKTYSYTRFLYLPELDLVIFVKIYKIFSYTVKTAVSAQSLKVAIAQLYTAKRNHVG